MKLVIFYFIIRLYLFVRENLQNRFQITSDHVAAARFDLAQKKNYVELHIPESTSRQLILMEKIKEFKIDAKLQ